MANVTGGYGRFSDLIAFLSIFIYTCLKRYDFIKLLQIVYQGKKYRDEISKPM